VAEITQVVFAPIEAPFTMNVVEAILAIAVGEPQLLGTMLAELK
jgi:hypothetical protein